MTQPNTPRARMFGAIVVVVVLVAAGIAGLWLFIDKGGGHPPNVQLVSDGPTFFQALSQVNNSALLEPGGPWALFSVYGIATQIPFSPNLIGYAHTNQTVNSCGQEFNGLTLWNGTMPLFNGTFNSGTAPFWQFAFFSNVSQEILVATSVLGVGRVYSPIPFPSSCMPWYDLPGDTTHWTNPALLPVADSSMAASIAWSSVLQGQETVGGWIGENNPMTQIITFGPGIFQGLGDYSGGYGLYFDRCGELGVAGIQPLVLIGTNSEGGWAEAANLTHNCALQYSGYGAFDGEYDLPFASPIINATATTTLATIGFQVAIAYPNGTLSNFFDEIGLANWMTGWNLSTSSGSALPLATPVCKEWAPALTNCPANDTGWYAVLLSSGGEWINSYGATPNGTSWSIPINALVSHQQLVIVTPSSWNLSGDKLTVGCEVPNTRVIGSVDL
ncbi:MAG: hypothetical protein WB809_06030 [Thermoplasmata archaeon]